MSGDTHLTSNRMMNPSPLAIHVSLSKKIMDLIPKISLQYEANRTKMDPICCIQIHARSKQERVVFFTFKTGVYQYALSDVVRLTFQMREDAISCYISVEDRSNPSYNLLFNVNILNKNNISDEANRIQNMETNISKLRSFIDESERELDFKKIRQCFVSYCIDFMYFVEHKRNDFVDLMKRECDLNTALSLHLWKHFVTNLNLAINDHRVGTNGISEEKILNDMVAVHINDVIGLNAYDKRINYAIESKLVSFIHSTPKSLDLKLIRRCFMNHNIGFDYFRTQTRKEFVDLMKKECALRRGTAIKLWNYFVDFLYAPQSNGGFIEMNYRQTTIGFAVSVDGTHMQRELKQVIPTTESVANASNDSQNYIQEIKQCESEVEAIGATVESLWSMVNDINSATVSHDNDAVDVNSDCIELEDGEPLRPPLEWGQSEGDAPFKMWYGNYYDLMVAHMLMGICCCIHCFIKCFFRMMVLVLLILRRWAAHK